MAVIMSLTALSIDAMLPALGQMGESLNVSNTNDTQLVISSIFVGMGFGLIFFGPFSDSFGRKPAIYIGISLFIVGCFISYFSKSFTIMLIGRFLQGLGSSSSRVITLAMIRDKYEGNTMAKIMSLIMIVFILVPAVAPSIGLFILKMGDWRDIFSFILVLSFFTLIWFAIRQPETLNKKNQRKFSLKVIISGISETFKNKITMNYTTASGLVFGAFIGYLSSAQQILQVQYKLGDLFPIYFGALALSIGSASFANSRWVEKYGMAHLCLKALKVMSFISFIFCVYAFITQGHPPLSILMIYMLVTFFCFGILFGNFNSLAIQPLGHIAGIANSVISSFQTLLSVSLGGWVGYMYNGTVLPLVLGFFIFGFMSLIIVMRTNKAMGLQI